MTKEQVKKILEQNDIIVKKQYGQNFLLDDNILKNIVKSAELKKDTNVIEIGPGLGFLTNYLQQATTNVLCYEIDEQMVEHLNELNYNISIINDDLFRQNLARRAKLKSEKFSVENIAKKWIDIFVSLDLLSKSNN